MSAFSEAVRGCQECPLLSDPNDGSPSCAADRRAKDRVVIPMDEQRNVVLAVPSECPLWAGPATVYLSLPGDRTVGAPS